MATLATIRTKVLRLVGDEDGVIFTSAILNDYINEAFQEISLETQVLRKRTTITTTDAEGMITLPSDFNRLVSLRYDNNALPKLHAGYIRPYFHSQATGTPSGYSVFSATKLLLYPIKASGTGLNIVLEYVALPATLSLDADVSELPEPLHNIAAQYALARCYQQLNDADSHGMAMADYNNRLMKWIARNDNSSIDSFESIREVDDWIP